MGPDNYEREQSAGIGARRGTIGGEIGMETALRKESLTERELLLLGSAVDSLLKQVDILENRLQGITTPIHEKSPQGDVPEEILSPIPNSIRSNRKLVDVAGSRIHQLINHLEI